MRLRQGCIPSAVPDRRVRIVGWDEQVAISKYSGAAEGKPLPMVLEMVVGPVDRGACIRDLSQYPKEVEYLYLPMSFISPDGLPRFRISTAGLCVRVIPVRVNINLTTLTVEQRLGQKKSMHCAAFRFLLGELRGELSLLAMEGGAAERYAGDDSKSRFYTVPGLIQRIVTQCEEVLKKHENRGEEDYTDNAVFQGLVADMLNVRRWAVSKLRLWLEDRTECISRVFHYHLRVADRKLTAYLVRAMGTAETEDGRRNAALEACKARGLLLARTDEAREDPLVTAAADGAAVADIRLLIAAGSLVNDTKGQLSDAARAAVEYGHADVLGSLLTAKAEVNAPSNVVMQTFHAQLSR